MNKIVVKSLVGQNGESLGAYVDYGDFCKMQSEYEEQIKKMKCCENCKHLGIYFDEETETIQGCIYQNECHNYDKWELEDE